MALDAPAPLYPTSSYTDTTPYSHDDMASLVASTSSGFTGLDTQHHYQQQQQQQQYQQNPLSHGSQAHAQAHAQAQAAAAAAAQQQGQLTQSLAGVGRRHRTVPAKTFKCTGFGDCAMVFSRSEHLARHVRKHTGERPFACHCSKQFSRLDNLRQHAQTVHADRPELNARMMARLVEVQGTMASLSKGGASSSPTAPSGLVSGKPHPPRALSLSLSLDTASPSAHVKSEGGSPDLSHHTQHPHLSLQQRKARRGALPLTLSSADIAAANMNAGFHLQGHATAPLPHGHGLGFHHPLSSPHAHGMHGHGSAHDQYPAAPHSASAHQTHFPHSQVHPHAQGPAFQPSFSLDGLAPAHHAHHVPRGGRMDFTQSEYGVPSHSHSHHHAHGGQSEYAASASGGSPAHEFPFYADTAASGPSTQALPSPPYSAASASGYFPSVPQKLEEMFEAQPQVHEQTQAYSVGVSVSVKQEDVAPFDAFPHPAHQQLHHQHSQTWSSSASSHSHSPNPNPNAGRAHTHAAYASPPITPHLANFPSLSLNGGGSSGSLSPHSAFSASPVIPPTVGGAFEGSGFEATGFEGNGFEGSGYEGSGYEGSLSPEQAAFESGFVHQQHVHQQQQQQAFDGGKYRVDHVDQHFDAQQQQQQQEYYHAAEQQHQQQQQQQQRWMAQQQYRREHGFAA